MDVRDFEQMNDKMSSLKEKRAKAEGVIEEMDKKMKELGCDNIEQLEDTIQTAQENIDSGEKKLAGVFKKLEEIADWGNL